MHKILCFIAMKMDKTRAPPKRSITVVIVKIKKFHHLKQISDLNTPVAVITVGDEGAVRSTCPLGEEEKDEERWKFGWQQ